MRTRCCEGSSNINPSRLPSRRRWRAVPPAPSACAPHRGGAAHDKADRNPEMLVGPRLWTRGGATRLEPSVRAVIAGHRDPEIVRSMWIDRFVGLLRVVSGPGQVAVEQSGCDLVAPNGCG